MKLFRRRPAAMVVAALVVTLPTLAQGADEREWPPSLEGPPIEKVQLSNWGKGLFEVRDPSLLGGLRAAPMARSPRTLTPGVVELGLRQTQESTYVWADDLEATDARGDRLHRLTISSETRDTHLVARVGVLPRIELGAELNAVHYQGGGFLDGLITGFHDTMGMGTMRRDELRRHAYCVEGSEPGGRRLSVARGTGIGDAYLHARALLCEGDDVLPAVSLTLSLWVPTASARFHHARGLAETVSIDASKRIGDSPVIVYLGGAFTYYGQANLGGLHLARERYMAYVGFEWEVHARFSIVAHFWQEPRRETKLFRSTNAVKAENGLQYIAMGVKVVPLPGVQLEVGALESFDKSMGGDFGFLANLWLTLGHEAE